MGRDHKLVQRCEYVRSTPDQSEVTASSFLPDYRFPAGGEPLTKATNAATKRGASTAKTLKPRQRNARGTPQAQTDTTSSTMQRAAPDTCWVPVHFFFKTGDGNAKHRDVSSRLKRAVCVLICCEDWSPSRRSCVSHSQQRSREDASLLGMPFVTFNTSI